MPNRKKVSQEISNGNQEDFNPPTNVKKCPTSVEEWEEMQLRSDFDELDTRKRPDYTVSYKQDVKTEDVFLQV